MLEVNDQIRLADEEFEWSYARSGGPGGQNVNKVASKAILTWNPALSSTVPEQVKIRLALLHKRFFTNEGICQITSQKFRDQERNRQDCLEKLRSLLLDAASLPKPRRPTRPTRGSKERRLEAKKHRAERKSSRQKFSHD
jgi:ribosome-associated protein